MIIVRKLLSKSNIIFYSGALVALAILLIWCIIHAIGHFIIMPIKKNRIREDLVVVNGAIINEIQPINKVSGVYFFKYTFSLEGDKYSNKVSIGFNFRSNNSSRDLIKKTFPVAYERKAPENSRLLIVSKEFEYFETPYPDSLLWIKKEVLE